MKVAVVGAGMAGLAAVWHLLQKKHSVVLFDPHGVGAGASGVSTGLLYPFPGRRALHSWKAEEGIGETIQLLQVANKALGHPVYEQSGILRLAISDQQKKDFKERGTWWKEEEVLKHVPLAAAAPGLWVPEGITVYSQAYLEGLWKACSQKGAKLERQAIFSSEELSSFDVSIFATGSETLQLPECNHLPLKRTLGQTLLCRWPERLPMSLVSQGHISPTEEDSLCQIGSTYEHSLEPSREMALSLLEKVAVFYPPARDFEIVDIRFGVRISPIEGYRPLCLQIHPKMWALTGFGSRGLLYHAMLAKNLVDSL